MKNGIVRRVTGPVVDVQFPTGHLPDIYNAIEIQLEDRKVVMEAMQQLGSDTVRCVSLFSTDGIARGCTAVDTGSPVTMPWARPPWPHVQRGGRSHRRQRPRGSGADAHPPECAVLLPM